MLIVGSVGSKRVITSRSDRPLLPRQSKNEEKTATERPSSFSSLLSESRVAEKRTGKRQNLLCGVCCAECVCVCKMWSKARDHRYYNNLMLTAPAASVIVVGDVLVCIHAWTRLRATVIGQMMSHNWMLPIYSYILANGACDVASHIYYCDFRFSLFISTPEQPSPTTIRKFWEFAFKIITVIQTRDLPISHKYKIQTNGCPEKKKKLICISARSEKILFHSFILHSRRIERTKTFSNRLHQNRKKLL